MGLGSSKIGNKTRRRRIIKSITDTIRGLCDYEEKGPKVSKMFYVVSDYRYTFVSRNYVFYRIEDKYIPEKEAKNTNMQYNIK